jgi:antagonist of KipI
VNATVLRAGFQTSVQDLGRSGYRQFGVSFGGALDSFALRTANLLVGNDQSATGLEITLGGLELRFADERLIAWGGGEFDVRIESRIIPPGHAAVVRAGGELRVGRPKIGCRSWLAISGGIDVPVVLGSRSTDLRAKFGGFDGRTLRDVDTLSFAANSERTKMLIGTLGERHLADWTPPHDWSNTAKREPILRFIRGVDSDRFDSSTLQRLTSEPFAVSPDSDRMGVRLEGPNLTRNDDVDLLSEGVAPGTIQVPPSGQPILLLGDCQTIGGYPKIAHVISVDLTIAAQLRAGDRVRFWESSLTEAHNLLIDRENKFDQFRQGIQMHLS